MHERAISIILAGGVGSRLHPLTAERAKPAVPFGGRYRIIDFTLSNCLHSGLRRIHRPDTVQIPVAAEAPARRMVDIQLRTGRVHHSRPPANADWRILVQRNRRRHLPESLPAGTQRRRVCADSFRRSHLSNGLCGDASVPLQYRSRPDRRVPDGWSGTGKILRRRYRGGWRPESFRFRKNRNSPGPFLATLKHALASMGVYVFSMKLLIELLHEDHSGDSGHDFGKTSFPP